MPADLGPLYQNQEADPDIAAQMMFDMYASDELPDIPSPWNKNYTVLLTVLQ